MNKDFEEYIARRCDDELNKNVQFMLIQDQMENALKNNDIGTYAKLSMESQIITERVCYKTAMIDIL